MHYITMIMLPVIAAIHLLPLVGACGKKNLFGLYGVSIVDPNLLILLRHRAVLFGLLGLACGCWGWEINPAPECSWSLASTLLARA